MTAAPPAPPAHPAGRSDARPDGRAAPRLRTTRGPDFTRILGIGDYRPARVIDNAELVRHIDSSDEWIRERSGVRRRHQAAPEETVVDMAEAAARNALDYAGIAGDEVDAVICATFTNVRSTPAAAPTVADRLGTRHAAAYDLSAACAGYCYGIATADDMIRAGRARHVVVIGVEKLSDFRNLADRGTAFIFGDGAGAAVLGPSDHPGVSATTWGSDGAGAGLIVQTPTWAQLRERTAPETLGLPGDARDDGMPDPDEHSGRVAPTPPGDADASWPYIAMKGPSVFRWAVSTVSGICVQALENAGITAADLDVFIPHQANSRIVEAMVKKLKLPDRVVVADDIANTANTSAASVPLATAALLRSGRAKPGDLALQIGFGAGLTWAAQVVVLP